LDELPFDHVLREFDEHIEDSEIALGKSHLERLHVEPVAGKHAAVISPSRVGGGTPAARVGAINDIVVNQRRGVNQLDDRAQTYGALSAIARVARGEKKEGRAQALSATTQKIAGDFGDRLVGRFILQPDFLFDLEEVVADQVKQFLCGQK
jgi:hypothetical protein